LNTVTSSSFKVYTKDVKQRLVNYIETDLFVTMPKGKFIPTAQVSTSNQTVGATSIHTISFNTVVPLTSLHSMVLIYPNQAKVPVDGCSPGFNLASITCETIIDTIKIKFET
jgi:hypothetical protein